MLIEQKLKYMDYFSVFTLIAALFLPFVACVSPADGTNDAPREIPDPPWRAITFFFKKFASPLWFSYN
ncbi:MAG: hypothetical protein FWG99_00695 [Treponema sp.]|nr:hypothetical protein [Treponema sp.]